MKKRKICHSYGLTPGSILTHTENVLIQLNKYNSLILSFISSSSLDPDSKTDLQLKNIIKELKNKVCETKTITDTFGIKDGESDT